MKKIEFGFSNDYDPNGSWEGIGIKPGMLLTDADYYGAIKYDGNSYIVAKVTEDEYNRFPHLLGNFIVRPAIADLFADGSVNIFLDQEESLISQQLEAHLNDSMIKDKIIDINSVRNYCNGVNIADKSFNFLTLDEKIITTSITHESFERKNSALKSCRSSFSQLAEEIISLSNKHSK